jgi:hypothetical protein
MNGKVRAPFGVRGFWLIDFMVILFFLSIAAGSLYLFRLDLMQTIDTRDEEPAGILVIRKNIVQRRHADRVLWDRLFEESPVYTDDLIRAADLSAATVYIDDNQIDLNENTLIRIQRDSKTVGPFKIELQEGNLSLSSGTEGSGIILNLMGRLVQPGPGTVLNAEISEEGLIIQVNEGVATFIEEGQSRELVEGSIVAQDAAGMERTIPMAVVKRPGPNARYLKNTPEPLLINFVWNSINIESGETLRLEIAADKNFNRNLQVVEGVDQAWAAFDEGLWYWRLSLGTVLSTGQLTVADASGPELLSPAVDTVFRYQNDLPQLRFQWSEKPGVSHYILELGAAPDLTGPHLHKQLAAASLIQSAPGPGTWYWRILPVFSSAYEGSALYSSVGSFRIEQTDDPRAPSLELPEPAPVNVPAAARLRAIAGHSYTVQPGDTLFRIAIQAYGSASQSAIIIDANNLENPNLIFVDQVLYIPSQLE